MTTVTYCIPNISCGHCVHTIQNEVGDLAGVQTVVASLDASRPRSPLTHPPPKSRSRPCWSRSTTRRSTDKQS